MWKNLKTFIQQTQSVGLLAPGVAIAVIVGNTLGVFNLLEWSVRDELFRRRPPGEIDERIVVVTIDESDLQSVGDWPIPDATLARLLLKIRAQQPRLIGLDLYRDLPEEPGHQQLLEVFKTTPQLIGVEKITGVRVPPPPILVDADQVAIADFVLDADQTIRRVLLSAEDVQTSTIKSTLAARIALDYLEQEGITLESVNPERQQFRLGQAVFQPLANRAAGYPKREVGGYQILMNWRGPKTQFQHVSMRDVLLGKIPTDLMRDRIVYIGSTAASTNDFFRTPYNSGWRFQGNPMPGVFVHANITSHLIDSALGGHPPLRGWTFAYQWGWIIFWTLLGTVGNWWLELYNHQEGRKRRWFCRPIVATSVGMLLVAGTSYLGFFEGMLIPFIPPFVALGAGAIATTSLFKQQRLHLTNQQLEFANQQLLDYAATLEVKVNARTRELDEAKQLADRANHAKSEFLANMSHELRTPLNGILGYAQILQNSSLLASEERNKISIIHQCGSHLLTLINDILDLSKIEARKLELTPAETDFPFFLLGIAEMCDIRAQSNGLAFTVHLDPDLPRSVIIDEKRLRQVLINLIGNAIKFTEQGNVTFNVKQLQAEPQRSQSANASTPSLLSGQQGVTPPDNSQQGDATDERSTPSTCWVRFSVEDTGIGMSHEQVNTIFLPFEQVSKSSLKTEGTGLGLAISQQIVALMGSQLHVQSQLGEGSVFWVDLQLPLAKAEHNRIKPMSFPQVIGIQGTAPRIMLVEDSQDDSSLLVNFLHAIGFTVDTAADGLEGVERVRQCLPDLIICDLVMPALDGLGFLNTIQHDRKLASIPVIIVSASVFAEDKQKSLEAGAKAFLPKPIEFQALLDILQSHLNLKWLYDSQKEPLRTSTVVSPFDTDEMVLPNPQVLQELYHLSMMGNLQEIEGRLREIAAAGPQFQTFVQTLTPLVTNFQIKQIRALLQAHTPSERTL